MEVIQGKQNNKELPIGQPSLFHVSSITESLDIRVRTSSTIQLDTRKSDPPPNIRTSSIIQWIIEICDWFVGLDSNTYFVY